MSEKTQTKSVYCKSFADKLRILSSLDWPTIESSPRETNGFEMLPVSALKEALPVPFTEHKQAMIFRFGGATGGRIVGVRDNKDRFYFLFIDHDFSFYDHGT